MSASAAFCQHLAAALHCSHTIVNTVRSAIDTDANISSSTITVDYLLLIFDLSAGSNRPGASSTKSESIDK